MTQPSSSPSSSIWPFVWLGVLGHMIWGSYPVFAKRAVMEAPKFPLPFFASLMATMVGLVLVLALSLLIGEDRTQWRTVSAGGWLAVMAVIWLVQVGGNVVQISALGGTNPALITSMMALRLVSALALAWLILGERLASPTQWLGVVLVIGAVTGYLWLQQNGKKSTSAP